MGETLGSGSEVEGEVGLWMSRPDHQVSAGGTPPPRWGLARGYVLIPPWGAMLRSRRPTEQTLRTGKTPTSKATQEQAPCPGKPEAATSLHPQPRRPPEGGPLARSARLGHRRPGGPATHLVQTVTSVVPLAGPRPAVPASPSGRYRSRRDLNAKVDAAGRRQGVGPVASFDHRRRPAEPCSRWRGHQAG